MQSKTKAMTVTALMTAVLCVLGPVTLPIGPVPISLTTLVLYFMVYILPTREALTACLLYILLGLAGLPVFSGYSGGPGKLFGPTGGYIIGYLPMIFIIGVFLKNHYKNRIASMIVMEAATWVLYLMGTAWLAYSAHMTFPAALAAGVIPFILLDLGKIVAAALLGPVLRSRLEGAGLMSKEMSHAS